MECIGPMKESTNTGFFGRFFFLFFLHGHVVKLSYKYLYLNPYICSSPNFGQKCFLLLLGSGWYRDALLFKDLRTSNCSQLLVGHLCQSAFPPSVQGTSGKKGERNIRPDALWEVLWILYSAVFWMWHGCHKTRTYSTYGKYTRSSRIMLIKISPFGDRGYSDFLLL